MESLFRLFEYILYDRDFIAKNFNTKLLFTQFFIRTAGTNIDLLRYTNFINDTMIFNKRVAFRVPASDITHLDYRAENKNQTSDIIFHLLPSPYSVVIVYKCQTCMNPDKEKT